MLTHSFGKNNYKFLSLDLFSYSDSKLLYITNSLRTFAEALIGIYIPIFIYKNDFISKVFDSNQLNNSGLLSVFAFYGIRAMIGLIFMHPIVNLIFGKFNFKGSIMIGNILLGVGLFLLGLSKSYPYLLIHSVIFLSLNSIFYWIPYHTIFIRRAVEDNGKFGKRVGMKQTYEKIATVMAPLAGGIIVTFYGFQVLFLIGLIILLVSGLPIAYAFSETSHGKHDSVKVFKKYISKKSLYYDTIAFAAMGIDNILFAILSTILIFSISNSLSTIGIITSLSVGTSILIAYKIGRMVDDYGPGGLQKLGLSLNTTMYIIRAFTLNPIIIYSIDFLDRINSNLLSIPFISSMYTHARSNRHESDFVIYRSYITEIAILISMVGCSIFTIYFDNWQLLFLFLAAISPLTYAINAKTPGIIGDTREPIAIRDKK